MLYAQKAMQSENQRLGYRSLTQCVMDYLREKLTDGTLQPGQEINLTSVCETLGVSRSPVREALIQLVKEGFIDAAERRRFRIRKLTPDEVRNLYETGGLLESEIVKSACARISEADLRDLESLLASVESALDKKDAQAFLERNGDFNRRLWRFCGNGVLVEFFSMIRERLYFSAKRTDADDWNRMLLSDHRRIVVLLRDRNVEGLERLLREEHWDYSRNLPFIARFYKFESNGETEK
jgi:DNA-binding GntR family transcriptional regulator